MHFNVGSDLTRVFYFRQAGSAFLTAHCTSLNTDPTNLSSSVLGVVPILFPTASLNLFTWVLHFRVGSGFTRTGIRLVTVFSSEQVMVTHFVPLASQE